MDREYIDTRKNKQLDLADNALLELLESYGLSKEQIANIGRYIPRLKYISECMPDSDLKTLNEKMLSL